MVARKLFGLLIVLLFTVFTFLAPIGASAVTCLEDEAQTFYINPDGSINPNGTFCAKASLLAAPTKCITKTGEIDCYEFAYTLTAINPGESLSQVGLLIPSKKKCTLSIFSPDRSQKVREYEPSTGFSSTDELTDVITWDALKLDSSNKEDINTYISTLCGTDQSTMQFKTASGLQYVSIYGPACCGVTQTPTHITYGLAGGSGGFGGSVDVDYQLCNYVPTAVSYTPPGASDKQSLDLLTAGVAYCQLNPRTGGFDSKLCWQIKKIGPREGAPIFTKKYPNPNCLPNETCDGYAYFGFGSKIYRTEAVVPEMYEPGEQCIQVPSNAPNPESVEIDGIVRFVPNVCGGTIYAVGGGPDPIAGPGISNDTGPLLIVPYNPDGSLNFSEASEFLYGSETGGIFYANPSCCIIGGYYRCPCPPR